jgi:predicted nucleic acid-binding protein
MQKGKIIDLNSNIAMDASKLSLQHNLPMADSIILATARVYDCVIWTQDLDFQHIEGVNYFPV